MIIEKINQCLIEKGFHNVEVNVKNIYLHYVVIEDEVYLVTLLNSPSGIEFSIDQYQHISKQIYDKFLNQNFKSIRLLNIICTNNISGVRNFISDGEQWILDTTNFQLILYENQKGDFLGLRQKIEKILMECQPEVGEADFTGEEQPQKKSFRPVSFSRCNTIIVILNVIIFLFTAFSSSVTSENLIDAGALNWQAVYQHNQYYRLFTYMFLHYGLQHVANNMIVLLVIGDNLERAMGKWKYVITYFASGVIAGIVSLSYNMFNNSNSISVGASGAIFGVVGAMVYIVIVNKGRLEDISIWQIALFVVFGLYGGLTSQGVDNAAHIGGLLAGVILAVILYRKSKKHYTEGRS